MHQHYKVVFTEDINNMNIFTELTFHFCMHCACQITCLRHPLYKMCSQLWENPSSTAISKSQIRIQQEHLVSLLRRTVFSPQCYWDVNVLWGRWWRWYSISLLPGQRCLSVERSPALSHPDWWMGRSEQSLKPNPAPAKGLRTVRSLSISHITLLVLACLSQRFSPHTASWSQVKTNWMLCVIRASLHL